MLLCLIISAVITWKLGMVDRQYAKRGETPPGTRLIEKWLDSRKARGLAPVSARPAKYGMWRYFWQRWQALWQGVTEEHAVLDERRRRERLEALAGGRTPAKGPTLREQLAADWTWVMETVTPKKSKPTALDEPTCPDCHQTLIARDGVLEHRSSSGCPAKPVSPESAAEDTPGSDTGPEASSTIGPATPPAPDHTTQEDSMTTSTSTATAGSAQSGEVVGLTSAIAYAEAVAQAHEAHSTGGGEGYRASLGQAKVGPDTINSAASAQEASEIAGAMWRAHAEKLREQLAAKEATTEETGTKEFLLNE